MSKMIVVDDEDAMEILFKHMFKEDIKSNSLEVKFFSNAKDALKDIELDPNEVSIILTDINMPHMDGFEFVQSLNEKNIIKPVLMISAYDDNERLEKAKQYGVVELVPKPLDFDYLRDRVREIIAHTHS